MALKDADAGVRCIVVYTIGELVKTVPGLAEQALRDVEGALEDEEAPVRRAAVVTLRKLVQAAPNLVTDALPHLLRTLKYEAGKRQYAAAVPMVKKLSGAGCGEGTKTQTLLGGGIQSTRSAIQEAVVVAIRKLGEVTPHLAAGVVPPLVDALCNEDRAVQEAAVGAIGKLVIATPSLAD